MSTPVNFFRSKRHKRTAFREGRFLLNTEGMELQLEVLTAIREQIRSVFGKDSAIEKALMVEVDPDSSERIIIRAGDFFLDGYNLTIQSGTDHLVGLGTVDASSNITQDDFIKIEKSTIDDGGIVIDFGGLTPAAAKKYSIVVSVEEQLITAAVDPFLRSANLDEDTADKHRIIVNINVIDSTKLNASPIPYTGTAAQNLVNEIEIERVGSTYSLVSTAPITGSESIDGRNLVAIFNNGNSGSTAAFPTSNDDLQEYVQGKLIDSNGVEFHITNIFVTPANPSQITMQLDLEKTRPVQLNTYQAAPVILEGIPYKLVKRDLYVTTPANLPVGKRFWEVAQVDWDGNVVTHVEDLRQEVLAYDGVISRIRDAGLTLYSEGSVSWDASLNGGTLFWDEPFRIASVYDVFEWSIAAGDTFSLFTEDLAPSEVLYVRLADAPLGGSLTLRKGERGIGDLAVKSVQAHKIMWIAKRGTDDRIYFNNGVLLNDQQTKPFYDLLPTELLTQDIITLGYKAMFEDQFSDASAINPTSSTGFYFAESFQLQYHNQVITIAGNVITVPNPMNFTLQVGDVVVQGNTLAVVVSVTSPTEFEVNDASSLSTGVNATISQVIETFNVRNLGDTPKEQISSYFSDPVPNVLVVYDDGVLPNLSNQVRVGFQATSDGSTYTLVKRRQQTLDTLETVTNLPNQGIDVRVRFFVVDQTSPSGAATLESFRVYLHKRDFVGTLVSAVAQQATTSVGAGNFLEGPELTNVSAATLLSGKAVAITSGGMAYASAGSLATATSTIGVLTDDIAPSTVSNEIVSSGLAVGVLTGLGFSSGDEVYLGLDGNLVNGTEVTTNPLIVVQKQIGFAVNSDDLWVAIQELEVL